MRRLERASIRVETISWMVLVSVAFVAGAVPLAIVGITLSWPIGWWIGLAAWLLLLAGLGWCTLRWPALSHRHTSYVVSAQGLEIRRGVIWRTVTNVPRSRIQHTDVVQGPLLRRYGLAALVVHTAGTEEASVSLAGVGREDALRIRGWLIGLEADDAV